jgi:hypothetical protein
MSYIDMDYLDKSDEFTTEKDLSCYLHIVKCCICYKDSGYYQKLWFSIYPIIKYKFVCEKCKPDEYDFLP